jgi:hypothetical protein
VQKERKSGKLQIQESGSLSDSLNRSPLDQCDATDSGNSTGSEIAALLCCFGCFVYLSRSTLALREILASLLLLLPCPLHRVTPGIGVAVQCRRVVAVNLSIDSWAKRAPRKELCFERHV